MLQLTYQSVARPTLMLSDIEAILDFSRDWNQKVGITGLLIYDGRGFMQALEGEADAVHSLFASIRRDSRHGQIRPMSEDEVPGRQFGEWTMASHIPNPIFGRMPLGATVLPKLDKVSNLAVRERFRVFAGLD